MGAHAARFRRSAQLAGHLLGEAQQREPTGSLPARLCTAATARAAWSRCPARAAGPAPPAGGRRPPGTAGPPPATRPRRRAQPWSSDRVLAGMLGGGQRPKRGNGGLRRPSPSVMARARSGKVTASRSQDSGRCPGREGALPRKAAQRCRRRPWHRPLAAGSPPRPSRCPPVPQARPAPLRPPPPGCPAYNAARRGRRVTAGEPGIGRRFRQGRSQACRPLTVALAHGRPPVAAVPGNR